MTVLFTNPEDRFSHRGPYNPYHKTNILCHTNNGDKGQNTLSLSALLVVHSSLKYNVDGSYFAKCLPQRLLKHFSRREKQTTFVAIEALRVKWKYLHTASASLRGRLIEVLGRRCWGSFTPQSFTLPLSSTWCVQILLSLVPIVNVLIGYNRMCWFIDCAQSVKLRQWLCQVKKKSVLGNRSEKFK